jgi:WD40 repeat protein
MEASPEKKGPPGTFGPKLRQERQRHHLSQEKLAEMVGCDVRSIRRWEQGKSIPDYENRHRLSKALDITLDDFNQLLQPEKHEKLIEREALDITLDDSNQLLQLGEGRDDKLIESNIPGTEILSKSNHSISIGSEESSKYRVQQQQRRALLKWGGTGLVAALAGGGLFYWFTRFSSSLSRASSSLSRASSSTSPVSIFRAPQGVGICAVEWSPHHDFIVYVDRKNIAQVIAVISNMNSPSQIGSGSTNNSTPTGPAYSYDPTQIGTAVNCITWSPDGTLLASPGITNNMIHIWNPQNRVETHFSYNFAVPKSIAWSNDSNSIATCGANGIVNTWWSTKPYQFLRVYPGHIGTVWRVAWSFDSIYLATAGADGTVRIWNTTTREDPLIYRGHRQAVFDVKWSPLANTHIVSASKDKTVQIWDPMTGKTKFVYTQHNKSVQAAEWSPDGGFIASAGADATIRVWDATTGKDYAIYRDHTSTIWALSWPPFGTDLASASEDGTMRIWSVNI